ncbi:MAG: prolyl oligopeptidase family serine peptidase [Firmicutes bacterium]|nr:prolyl oligopeptidase family serine peptidase [Bacillota bacterium]
MKKRKLWIILPACLLALCIGLTVANTVIIAGMKDKVAALEGEVASLENLEVERMGLLAGEYEALPYRVYVPENAGAKLPLLLYLHGAGSRQGDDNRRQVIDNSFFKAILSEESLAAYPCVILAPQCPQGKGWVRQPWGPGIAAQLMGMLEQACAEYPVDRSRIYITGVSMGGFGTWGMLRAYPDYFAAAVPICGGWDLDDDVALAPAMKDVPIWAFHGALDMTVPVERTRDMVKALQAVGGDIQYTEYPDEYHGIAARVYNEEPELFPWLFAQAKK